MSRKSDIVKDAVLVTVGSLLSMILSFGLYYLIFLIFETTVDRAEGYNFVAPLRVGFGIVLLILCVILYRTRIPELLKANILAGSLTSFLVGIGVQLYRTPVIFVLIMLFAAGTAVFLLRKATKKWFHYYVVALSILAALFYCMPFRG